MTKTTTNNDYTSDDIDVLDNVEYVRLRTHNFFGNMSISEHEVPIFSDEGFHIEHLTFVPAAAKAFDEIVDNCIDEFHNMQKKVKPTIKIIADPQTGHYSIGDNGRGVPIDKHTKTGKPTPEVVFGMLQSGRNFKDGKEEGVRGQNGVGSACVNFCSTEFKIDIKRDKKHYKQTFSQGSKKVTKPSVRSIKSTQTGTTIEFKLDPKVFKSVSLPPQLIRSKCYEVALCNPGVTIVYEELGPNGTKFKVSYRDTEEGLKKQFPEHQPTVFKKDNTVVAFIPDFHEDDREKIFGWVNSGPLIDGGLCNTQLSNTFFSYIEDKLASSKELEKVKKDMKIDKRIARAGTLLINIVNVSDPQYDAQHKSRFVGPCLREFYKDSLNENIKMLDRKLKDWTKSLEERVLESFTQKLTNSAKKKNKENSNRVIPGFLEANTKNREDAVILITEGTSASGEIKSVRDTSIHAVFEQRGKVNNVFGASVAKMRAMGKYTDMLSVLNLVPGAKTELSDVPYGKIIIATDADHDGDDIFTLDVNMFYTFWPELLQKGQTKIYRLIAPNVVVIKGKKRIHFRSLADFEKVSSKYKGCKVEYMKGLGSMEIEDWKIIFEDLDSHLMPIEDDGKLGDTLDLLFNQKRSDDRKIWLGEDWKNE